MTDKKPTENLSKVVEIVWKEGGSTALTVHAKTNVLLAYDPVLKYIKRITEITFDGVDYDEKIIFDGEKE